MPKMGPPPKHPNPAAGRNPIQEAIDKNAKPAIRHRDRKGKMKRPPYGTQEPAKTDTNPPALPADDAEGN
jgi:hypothetical protein